jgi:hypothetical protein
MHQSKGSNYWVPPYQTFDVLSTIALVPQQRVGWASPASSCALVAPRRGGAWPIDDGMSTTCSHRSQRSGRTAEGETRRTDVEAKTMDVFHVYVRASPCPGLLAFLWAIGLLYLQLTCIGDGGPWRRGPYATLQLETPEGRGCVDGGVGHWSTGSLIQNLCAREHMARSQETLHTGREEHHQEVPPIESLISISIVLYCTVLVWSVINKMRAGGFKPLQFHQKRITL